MPRTASLDLALRFIFKTDSNLLSLLRAESWFRADGTASSAIRIVVRLYRYD